MRSAETRIMRLIGPISAFSVVPLDRCAAVASSRLGTATDGDVRVDSWWLTWSLSPIVSGIGAVRFPRRTLSMAGKDEGPSPLALGS